MSTLRRGISRLLGRRVQDSGSHLDPAHLTCQAKTASTEVTCQVCLEDLAAENFPMGNITHQCAHDDRVCFNCLQQTVDAFIGGGNLSLLVCPIEKCAARLSYENVRSFSTEDNFARYNYLLTKGALDEMEDVVMCLGLNCGSAQVHEGNNPIMICYVCKFKTCAKHGVPWHTGETCAQFDANKAATPDEAARQNRKSESLIQTITRKCPKCRIRVEKRGGCRIIHCTCGNDWCWNCFETARAYHELIRHRSFCREGDMDLVPEQARPAAVGVMNIFRRRAVETPPLPLEVQQESLPVQEQEERARRHHRRHEPITRPGISADTYNARILEEDMLNARRPHRSTAANTHDIDRVYPPRDDMLDMPRRSRRNAAASIYDIDGAQPQGTPTDITHRNRRYGVVGLPVDDLTYLLPENVNENPQPRYDPRDNADGDRYGINMALSPNQPHATLNEAIGNLDHGLAPRTEDLNDVHRPSYLFSTYHNPLDNAARD